MKSFIRVAIVLVLFAAAPPARAAQEAVIKLGVGKTDMTPLPGTPLAGYGKMRKKVSVGSHDPLFARALALTKEGQTFVFISADLVLIDEELRKAVVKKITARHAVTEEHIVIFATHTHTGTGGIGGRFWERFIMGKRRRHLFENTVHAMAHAAGQALESQAEAMPELGVARIDLLVENRMDERLDLPDTLRVLRFKRPNGSVRALMIFMAAHPTLFPAKELLHSADFPGALSGFLENEHPGAVTMFVNGAAADLRPKGPPIEPRMKGTEVYGLTIAQTVQELAYVKTSLDGPWRAALQKIKLPKTRIRLGPARIPSLLGNRFFPRKVLFQAVRLGPKVFLSFPGELSSELGLEIERAAAARGLEPFLIGYANDYIAYVVPHAYYNDRSQYESSVSFYGPKMGWFVQEKMTALAESLLSAQEKAALRPPGSLTYKEGLPVLRLKGDPYHLGFEEGRLLKKEIRQGVDDVFSYLRSEVPVPVLNRLGINWVLDRAWKKAEPYVLYDEYRQMRGLADGAEISFKTLRRLHMMPEVYPTWCSNGAYWGKSTADGRLIALRNLDWNRKMGIHRHAAVKWLETPGRLAYANIGYYGFTGVLSGMNEKGISVGQIGAPSAEETLEGVPMPFLLKRILEEASSLEEAAAIFERTPLTRGYNYVIADAAAREALAVEATAHHLALFRQGDAREKNSPYGEALEDAIVRADPALDPVIRDLQTAAGGKPDKQGVELPTGSSHEIRYKKHADLVKSRAGKIDALAAQKIALEIAPGSNIQSVIYTFPEFFVANAQDDKRAAEGPYVRFDLEEFKEGTGGAPAVS